MSAAGGPPTPHDGGSSRRGGEPTPEQRRVMGTPQSLDDPIVISPMDGTGPVADSHVLVRLRPGVRPATLERGVLALVDSSQPASTPRLLPRVHQLSAEWATAASANLLADIGAVAIEPLFPPLRHQALASVLGLDRTYRVELRRSGDTPAIAARLAQLSSLVEIAEVDGIGGTAQIPNDPEFPQQWNMLNTGQFVAPFQGVIGSDVNATPAWDIALEASSVLFGLLDSGVNEHVELAGRIYPGFNIPDGTTITADECSSHGTHVAGILTATRNNGVGVAGVAANVFMHPWVVTNPCAGFESWLATALTQATDEGMQLVNMSLQYSTGTAALQAAVEYADAAGVIMVAAAGNSASMWVSFPGRWPQTICVSGTLPNDAWWDGSNYGVEVDLCAPAFQVRSTTNVDTYGPKTGTSMACPHVSGTIALMLSKNPTLTAAEIRAILESTATDMDTPGFDPRTGHGRLNVHAALLATPVSFDFDLNGDGMVGAADLAILLGQWGPCLDCDGGCPGDFDHDCAVGPADLALLLGAWS